MCATECTKIASLFASDVHRRHGYRKEFRSANQLCHFYSQRNRRSLAISDRKEIAHLGALKIVRCCGGVVKIAAATAGNRAILLHASVRESCPARMNCDSQQLWCQTYRILRQDVLHRILACLITRSGPLRP